jgi:hypothetical protein
MQKKQILIKAIFIFVILLIVPSLNLVFANSEFQETVLPPTVTGTSTGPMAVVIPEQNEDSINVRSGPNSLYQKVGVLLVGQTVQAIGKSPGGDWIQINYPGVQGGKAWVFSSYVDITGGELPIVEPPPSPTPQYTSTIDPTLAAQFMVTVQPTRLPTFTEPAPLLIPTYEERLPNQLPGGVPVGLIIVVLGVTGILLGAFSFFQSR